MLRQSPERMNSVYKGCVSLARRSSPDGKPTDILWVPKRSWPYARSDDIDVRMLGKNPVVIPR